MCREKMKQVSIVLLTFNQTSTVLLTCKRLAQQISKRDGEIIVVDVSQENFPPCALKSLHEIDAIIAYIPLNSKPNGRAMGRNIGVEQARGRIVILLDGDMIPDNQFIAQHISLHTSPEYRRLVAGHRTWLGEIHEVPGEFAILTNDWLVDMIKRGIPPALNIREKRELQRRGEFLQSESPWRACFTCNLSFLRSDFVPFDTAYSGWGFEDWDFAWRMFNKGIRPVFRQSINAYHVENACCVGNIFRNPYESGIIRYLHNSFYFYEHCLDLTWDKVFFGSDRIILNGNTFEVVSRMNAIAPGQMPHHLVKLRSRIDETGTLYKRKIESG